MMAPLSFSMSSAVATVETRATRATRASLKFILVCGFWLDLLLLLLLLVFAFWDCQFCESKRMFDETRLFFFLDWSGIVGVVCVVLAVLGSCQDFPDHDQMLVMSVDRENWCEHRMMMDLLFFVATVWSFSLVSPFHSHSSYHFSSSLPLSSQKPTTEQVSSVVLHKAFHTKIWFYWNPDAKPENYWGPCSIHHNNRSCCFPLCHWPPSVIAVVCQQFQLKTGKLAENNDTTKPHINSPFAWLHIVIMCGHNCHFKENQIPLPLQSAPKLLPLLWCANPNQNMAETTKLFQEFLMFVVECHIVKLRNNNKMQNATFSGVDWVCGLWKCGTLTNMVLWRVIAMSDQQRNMLCNLGNAHTKMGNQSFWFWLLHLQKCSCKAGVAKWPVTKTASIWWELNSNLSALSFVCHVSHFDVSSKVLMASVAELSKHKQEWKMDHYQTQRGFGKLLSLQASSLKWPPVGNCFQTWWL